MVDRLERKYVFGEDKILVFLTCVLVLVDKMGSLQKVYTISTSQCVDSGPLAQTTTTPSITLDASSVVEDTSAIPGADQLIHVSTALTMEDQSHVVTTPTKRDPDLDQSPLLEKNSPKWDRLSRGFTSGSTTPLLKNLVILPS